MGFFALKWHFRPLCGVERAAGTQQVQAGRDHEDGGDGRELRGRVEADSTGSSGQSRTLGEKRKVCSRLSLAVAFRPCLLRPEARQNRDV